MRKHITFKTSLVVAMTVLLTACGFFDKDNTPIPTPLTNFTPEVKPHLMWSTRTGGGSSDEYLKMSPAMGTEAIYTASVKGLVTSINKTTGRVNWQNNTHLDMIGGPGAGDGIVVATSRQGDVMAISQADGSVRWKTVVPGEIIARPAVADNHVVIKTVDGYLRALSTQDGHELWAVQQVEPGLILRGGSTPLIRDGYVIAGFANGNLAKFNLSGEMVWTHPVAISEGAFAIQRMVDIDADPLVYQHDIYAATYQGKIAYLDWSTGQPIWSHDISSYTGMIADDSAVYISDAKSHIWAFTSTGGLVNWRQTKLDARVVSGPTLMSNYVVVGDAQGYLHWLSKQDGHFAGREYAGGAIYAAPIAENNVLYVLTNNGYLRAYTLNR